MTDRLTIRRPDDWHVHLRDGAMLAAVAPYTARQFARAIVMPNLDPPVTNVAAAEAYRDRILAAVGGVGFTPHHLVINRNALFAGGLRPHAYCLPVAKREEHRLAVRRAATSGSRKFFLGTDSAPHAVESKESACGCAGIFNAPFALETYAAVFEEEGALDR